MRIVINDVFLLLRVTFLTSCRGGITADAIGWLKLWARIDVGESGEGMSVQETLIKIQARTREHKEQEQVSGTKNQEPNGEQHTRFTLLWGP